MCGLALLIRSEGDAAAAAAVHEDFTSLSREQGRCGGLRWVWV